MFGTVTTLRRIKIDSSSLKFIRLVIFRVKEVSSRTDQNQRSDLIRAGAKGGHVSWHFGCCFGSPGEIPWAPSGFVNCFRDTVLLTDVAKSIYCGLRRQLISAYLEFVVYRAGRKNQGNLAVCVHWSGQLMVLAKKVTLAVGFCLSPSCRC